MKNVVARIRELHAHPTKERPDDLADAYVLERYGLDQSTAEGRRLSCEVLRAAMTAPGSRRHQYCVRCGLDLVRREGEKAAEFRERSTCGNFCS